MAISKLPIQQGANLASLDRDEEIQDDDQHDDDIEALEEELGLDPGDSEGEVIELEDGSVIVNYEKTDGPLEKPEFYANLADVFDESTLLALSNEYLDYIEVDREARKERDKQQEEGLRRTGLGHDAPGGAVFDGASKVVHPAMAEACVDFAASVTKELLPPEGVVKSDIKGKVDQQAQDAADRKVTFMNWQLTEQIPEFRDESEIMFTQLPLGGSQFVKWRYDSEQRRPMYEWVPIDAILLPYASTNFYTAQRVTEVQDITEDEYQQRIEKGIYRDLENAYVSDIDSDEQTRSQQANDKIEGKDYPSKNVDEVRRIYEITCFMRLDDDDETEGRRAPYILTIDETSGSVLSLYRNWAYGDEKLEKLDWYVEYKFIPWRGAYAIGLPQLIGGLSAALTGALRALMDAAHINNSQTMLKLKSGRIGGQSDRIEPTQVVEVEGAPGVDDVRKIAMPMPFNPPSPVLFQLLGWLTEATKGVVTTAEEKISDVNSNTPVGTTQALIEQGAKVFSSIHARLHRSQAKSFKILSRINNWYLEEMDNESGVEIEVRDFADNTDIRPISDPNIFSETQRIAQTQATLQMATSAPPGMFDLRAVYARLLKQLKIPNVEEILPNPEGLKESNPALENVSMTMGRPAAAYPDQDHLAHIKVHLAYAQDPNYGGSPLIGPTFAPHAIEHIKQHLSLHYLQSMRDYVAQASGENKDTLDLHTETPLSQDDQQALALAAQMVQQDSRMTFAQDQQGIMQLFQKVQQMTQAQQEAAITQDPTANVLLKTQMAETQRKTQEAQQDAQMEIQRSQQEYQIKVAELQAKVKDLQEKYQTQTQIDSQRNATQIAMANINNAAKERVAQITAGAQFTIDQMGLEHEQNMSALEAVQASEQDIRQHGLAVQQQAFEQQAQVVQQQIEAQQAAQQHAQQMAQNQQAHQQQMDQNQQAHEQQMQQQQEQQVAQPQQGQ
jgi:hypothetical protein